MIRELIIVARDKIGLLADISYILTKEKINIEQIGANAIGNNAVISLGVLSAKYNKARSALEKNKYSILPMESIIVKMKDKSGALAEMTRKLANAKISILNIHKLGKQNEYAFVSIIVDKQRKTKKILSNIIVNEME